MYLHRAMFKPSWSKPQREAACTQ